MRESMTRFVTETIIDLAQADTQLVLLAVLLVCVSIVLDVVGAFASKQKQRSGVAQSQKPLQIDGARKKPSRDYISEIQGIAGRPDAVIFEDGKLIPVERKPLANKIRDRYIAQLLMYMRLIEEFEGQRPPYGYLILGKNCRRVKIQNTAERQAWLQGMLDEMRAHLENSSMLTATPESRKCKKCKFQSQCSQAFSERLTAPGGNVLRSS
jgi:predicted RecB family nuclease